MSLDVYRFQFSAWARLLMADRLPNFKSTLIRPQESIAEIQFQFQPALLRLSAMLSQCFTRCSMRVYDSLGNVIETHEHARFQTTVTRNRTR
jgi:hypothetical protein